VSLDREISVRDMLRGEEGEVRDFFERNLGFVDSVFLNLAFRYALKSAREQLGETLVAVCGGGIVGGVSPGIAVCLEERSVCKFGVSCHVD